MSTLKKQTMVLLKCQKGKKKDVINNHIFCCGTWSRTKTDGFRDRCSAIKLFRMKEENYNNFES